MPARVGKLIHREPDSSDQEARRSKAGNQKSQGNSEFRRVFPGCDVARDPKPCKLNQNWHGSIPFL
jgi:hypothetical protein